MARQLSTLARPSALVAAVAIALAAALSVPAHAADETRSISGTVTLPAGAPSEWLDRIWVSAIDSSGASAGATLTSSADGTYTIDDLAPGRYRIRFRTVTRDPSNNSLEYWTGPLLSPTYWPDRTEGSHSIPYVDVTKADARGIDRTLEYSGSMSGTLAIVTASTPSPSPGHVSVVIAGQRGSIFWIDPSVRGEWTAPRIPADTYTVSYVLHSRGSGSIARIYPDVADEYYDGVCHSDDMKPVVVAPGASTTGIDTTLEPRVFTDIAGTTFEPEIRWLATEGITTGYQQRDCTYLFAPRATVTRGQMAAFLYRAAGSPTYASPSASPFVDVEPSSPFSWYISWLSDQGVSQGWATARGREFRPNASITREQMAAFLYRFADVEGWKAPARSPFADVTTTSTFYKEISWLAASGISTGWTVGGATQFRPGASVTREQMAAFLYRLDDLA